MVKGSGHFEVVAAQLAGGYRTGWAEAFTKAAVAAQDWSSAWGTDGGRNLADAFLKSIRDRSVLDACAPFATPVDPNDAQAQMLSGASADVVAEGGPSVATKFALNPRALERITVSAIIAMSRELARLPQANRIIANELREQVSTASNTAFLGALTATSATAGSTASATLKALLDALDDAEQVVVAAPASWVRDLAMEADGRIGLRGGVPFPGVQVIATKAASGAVYAVPADRLVLTVEAFDMSPAHDATVQVNDAPDSPATASTVLTSLWQNSLQGLRVSRAFRVHGACAKAVLS